MTMDLFVFQLLGEWEILTIIMGFEMTKVDFDLHNYSKIVISIAYLQGGSSSELDLNRHIKNALSVNYNAAFLEPDCRDINWFISLFYNFFK